MTQDIYKCDCTIKPEFNFLDSTYLDNLNTDFFAF